MPRVVTASEILLSVLVQGLLSDLGHSQVLGVSLVETLYEIIQVYALKVILYFVQVSVLRNLSVNINVFKNLFEQVVGVQRRFF